MTANLYEGGSGPVVDASVIKRKDGSTVTGEVPVVAMVDSTGALVDPPSAAGQTTNATLLGAVTETAPATDTASSGLNGRLQRLAQRLSSLIAQIPTALGQGTMAQSLSVAIASNQSALTVGPASSASGANPNGKVRIKAAASTNAAAAKSSAGRVFGLMLQSAAAYDVFFKFYNKATAPTVGTDVPVHTVKIPAGGTVVIDWSWGDPFSTGIAYAITKLYADTDTTVVVADDVYGTLIYA